MNKRGRLKKMEKELEDEDGAHSTREKKKTEFLLGEREG